MLITTGIQPQAVILTAYSLGLPSRVAYGIEQCDEVLQPVSHDKISPVGITEQPIVTYYRQNPLFSAQVTEILANVYSSDSLQRSMLLSASLYTGKYNSSARKYQKSDWHIIA